MAEFAIAATGSTPWFQLLGRGKIKAELPGTWAGSVAIQRKRPDGEAATYMSPAGEAAVYTSNPGVLDLDDPGPIRFTFTRDSGTAEPFAWSDDGLLYFPDADGAGGGLTFEQLPTADPEDSGALWNNSGVVTVSAG